MKRALAVFAVLSLTPQAGPPVAFAHPGASKPRPAFCLEPGNFEGDRLLVSRIGPPDPAVVEIFAGAGASGIAVHDLTEEERGIVGRALARLPRLHRAVLQRHLRRLSFLDLRPGAGSALTSRAGPDGAALQFDITLRASLLDESLTTFLNAKEARLFGDDGSGFRIDFDAGDSDALTYVLLHETSHVVDQVMGVSDDESGPFRADVWDGLRNLSEPHASSLAAKTPFRREPPIPLRYSPAFYESLRKSPFVSFYATAAAPEDLAELFAWQQLAYRFDQSLTLTIRDREGSPLYRYEPLASPAVQLRFGNVQALLDRHGWACDAAPSS